MTTNDFFLLKGLHSDISTLSPFFAWMHCGMWAVTFELLRIKRSYFGMVVVYDQLTVTLESVFSDIIVPRNVLPLTLRLP